MTVTLDGASLSNINIVADYKLVRRPKEGAEADVDRASYVNIRTYAVKTRKFLR
jgi:hypothetical protein